ncbi:MAG: sigma-70 family RNA polymerase sigma factor [Planctomycetia bacterium]|nr:sigma-70 family RNA polymerase sigma factor [Planctomycetia bacterium]
MAQQDNERELNPESGSGGKNRVKDRASALFLQHIHYVEAVAFRVAPIAVVQDDIVHDAFVDFIEKAEQWDLEKDVRPLLRGIAENIGKQYWRDHLKNEPEKIRRIFEYGLVPVANEGQEERVSNLDDQIEALRVCMKKLSPTCQLLLHLYYVLGKSYREISEETGKSEGTLQKACSRLRDNLFECIERILAAEVRKLW